jgi:hypothetical protein
VDLIVNDTLVYLLSLFIQMFIVKLFVHLLVKPLQWKASISPRDFDFGRVLLAEMAFELNNIISDELFSSFVRDLSFQS